MTTQPKLTAACPVPKNDYDKILLSHGGGGTMMHKLINDVFLQSFGTGDLNTQHDSTVVDISGARLALTTDSFVIKPLFFPGGDIGSLAVHGTINDLAMSGARPLYLTASFILEEGFPIQELKRITDSMQKAADACHVQIVTGDTKVVEKGKGDSVFVNTTGVGILEHAQNICPKRIRPNDKILINGDIGRHGMAVMAQREGLEFDTEIKSDSAPLADLVINLLNEGLEPHCLRDLTRGGLASALNEMAAAAGVMISLKEADIPVTEDVKAACEMLGFDPLYVANEGRLVVVVPDHQADKALCVMRSHAQGKGAMIIGQVKEADSPMVLMQNQIGATRVVDMLSGEQLPRIC